MLASRTREASCMTQYRLYFTECTRYNTIDYMTWYNIINIFRSTLSIRAWLRGCTHVLKLVLLPLMWLNVVCSNLGRECSNQQTGVIPIYSFNAQVINRDSLKSRSISAALKIMIRNTDLGKRMEEYNTLSIHGGYDNTR